MSVVGTVLAAKAKKEGQASSRIFFILGVTEILICILGVICAVAFVLLKA